MNKENVKQIIKELSYSNFKQYPESYPLNEDGAATDETTIEVQDLGSNYYDNRTDSEIQRDDDLGITEIDYVEWCMESFSNYLTD